MVQQIKCGVQTGLHAGTLYSSVNSEIPFESLKTSVNTRQISWGYLNLLNGKSLHVRAQTQTTVKLIKALFKEDWHTSLVPQSKDKHASPSNENFSAWIYSLAPEVLLNGSKRPLWRRVRKFINKRCCWRQRCSGIQINLTFADGVFKPLKLRTSWRSRLFSLLMSTRRTRFHHAPCRGTHPPPDQQSFCLHVAEASSLPAC